MAPYRYDPYLWVHLAGLATVPLWLAICTLGLAVGSPQWPSLEFAFLILVGVSPALVMQLGKPFYIFSLLALTLKPTALSDDRRRLLTLFQQRWVRSLAMVAPVPLVWLLWEIYPRAIVASDITPFAPWGRLGGLAVAAGSVAMANLFLQVPISVLAVMATSEKRFRRTSPYPLDQIQTRFTRTGLALRRILPEILPPEGALPSEQEAIELDLDPAIDHDETDQPAAEDKALDAVITTMEGDHLTTDALGTLKPRETTLDPVAVIAEVVVAGEAMVDVVTEMMGGEDDDVVDVIPEVIGFEDDDSVDVTPEALGSESGDDANDGWDPDRTRWDQTTHDTAHDWEHEPDWETSLEATPDRNRDVAMVRISDPT